MRPFYVLFVFALFTCSFIMLFVLALFMRSLYSLFLCSLFRRSDYVPFLYALFLRSLNLPFLLDWYLVGFWICAEVSGIFKKNWLEKLVSPVKRSALLHASTLQNFARRHFFDVNEVSIVFS